MTFDDQVFIVSGGASGMGRATATLLAQGGARVVIADIDQEAGERVAGAIGANATLEPTDLRSLEEITALVARTRERFGRIDGVANVAAIYPYQTFLDVSPADWQEVDDVNHRAVFFLAQAVARAMIDDGRPGAIVNVASGAAYRAVPGQATYTGTKAAVVGLTRLMAHELLPHGIRVNVVAPGHTASETVLRHTTQEQRDTMAATLVGQRWMEPEEVARAIAFLLGDGARGMTGAVIHVNEGNYMPH
jgi:NAD(P)-dependent dehydrogenase (short-subunit alcohol dehydrogenase family)